jgi:hypothetical protein
MLSLLNLINKHKTALAAAFLTLLFCIPSEAQLFKKWRSKKGFSSSEYAYATISTTKRKERKAGYGGENSMFHFEKPRTPISKGRFSGEINTSDPTYFGHRRPPIRKSHGAMRMCRVCGIKHH